MATMREVAARAGVSAKTVSRVFNDDPHVLPETREHVERVMRDLNYMPNVLATTFRTGQSSAIGVAVPDIADPYFAEIARAVDGVAQRQQTATLLTSLGDDPQRERNILESLLSRRLAGLIVAPIGTDHSWLKRWKDQTPVVFVDRAPFGFVADTFTDDDESGGHLATSHLIAHGHRRIAYLGDMFHLSTETNRLAGYRRALREVGVEPDDALLSAYVGDRPSAQAALDRAGGLPDPPTAVFSANARTSMSLMPAIRARARQGRPLAVVGFGDFPMADVLEPSLTVVDQDPAGLGIRAAERILARRANPTRRLRRTNVLGVSLTARESCAAGQQAGCASQARTRSEAGS